MADRSPIEWTEATWNPIGGCTRVDEGCRNCYAEVMAARFSKPGKWGEGLARMVKGADGRTDHRWTGKMVLHEAALDRPLRWRRPRLIFVNSTSDLFHESVPDDWIDRVFAVMALAPQHTFQVLTKRPDRARRYLEGLLSDQDRLSAFAVAMMDIQAATGCPSVRDACARYGIPWSPPRSADDWLPLRTVWLGTSISDQASADARIPELLACPAAVRFVSAEPLLGPVDLEPWLNWPDGGVELPSGKYFGCAECETESGPPCNCPRDRAVYLVDEGPRDADGCPEYVHADRVTLDWVICGGESGPGARPMHPDWARSLRDQCVAAGVPFFFKQWGEWGPGSVLLTTGEPVFRAFRDFQHWVNKASTWVNGGACLDARGRHCKTGADMMRARDEGAFPVTIVHRVGKKAAGRLLDGRTWDQMPAGWSHG